MPDGVVGPDAGGDSDVHGLWYRGAWVPYRYSSREMHRRMHLPNAGGCIVFVRSQVA